MTELLVPRLYTSAGVASSTLFQLLFGAQAIRGEDRLVRALHFPGALGAARPSYLRTDPLQEDLENAFRMNWQTNPFDYRVEFGPGTLTETGIEGLALLSKALLQIDQAYAFTVANGRFESLVSAGMPNQTEEIYQTDLRSVRELFLIKLEAADPFAQVYEGVIPLTQPTEIDWA